MKTKPTLSILILFFVLWTNPEAIVAQTKIYGTTLNDGAYQVGTIFSMDTDGSNFENVHDFHNLNINNAIGTLLKVDENTFCGITTSGGNNNLGTLFKFNPDTYVINILYHFTSRPKQITLASNGKIYGVCSSGRGFIFSYDVSTNTYQEEYVFDGDFYIPHQIVEATPGIFYGTVNVVPDSGYAGSGGIFSFSIAEKTATLEYKLKEINVANPFGKSILASNNKIYGTTHGVYYNSGSTNNKTSKIYEYDITTNTAVMVAEITNPARKFYDVWELKTGYVYGVMNSDSGFDEIFKINIETHDMEIIGNAGPLGSFVGKLLLASDDKVYGLTLAGGANNRGTIFSFNINDEVLSVNYDFESYEFPEGGLTEMNLGELVGYSLNTSTSLEAFFKYNLTENTFEKIQNINSQEGLYPVGLTQAEDKLFGCSYNGGENNLGNIFYYDPKLDELKAPFAFTNETGSGAYGTPVYKDGFIYGTTAERGEYNHGTLFKFELATETFTKLHDFTELQGYSFGSVMFASNGLMYGFTSTTNSSPDGIEIIFSYDIDTDTFSVLHEFADGEASLSNGYFAEYDGKLYATSKKGGSPLATFSHGTIFSYDFNTDTYSTEYDLNTNPNISLPHGSLLLASNNKLYGLSEQGGASGLGTIYEFDPVTKNLSILHSFSGSDGQLPIENSLIEVDGKLLGNTSSGGINDKGSAFSYDILTNTFTKLKDFDATSGSNPIGNLTALSPSSLSNTEFENRLFSNLEVYPNPSNGIFNLSNPNNLKINKLRLFDVSGKEILASSQQLDKIDTSKLSKGIYFLKVDTSEGSKTFKIFKE